MHIPARICSFGIRRACRRRLVVLDDVTQAYGWKGVFVLDTALDMNQPFFIGIVTLCGVGQ